MIRHQVSFRQDYNMWGGLENPPATGWFHRIDVLADLEAALGGNVWLDGNEFTVGDLMMISVLGGLRGTAELDGFPCLAAYVARGENRPAHRKAMADHMATFDAPVLA